MYADYKFYKDEYMGSLIPETAFAGIERAASAYIDYITHNRIPASDLPESVMVKVKMSVCAVAEACYKQESDEDSTTVSSESVGNHSKSFAVVKRSFADREREKLTKANVLLFSVTITECERLCFTVWENNNIVYHI